MFRELVEFKEKHGHTKVPQNSVEYGKLGRWVQKQRADHQKNRPILAGRRKRVDEIRFVWRLVESNSWDEMFARLVEYRNTHGYCNVPQKWHADRRLGRWVNHQRDTGRKLTKRQVELLESVGFVWNTKLPSSSTNRTKSE